MSRAGRRARRQRLATERWDPAAVLTAGPGNAASDRAAVLAAERAAWVAAAGTLGWEREQARRRGERNRVLRARRIARALRRVSRAAA